MKLPLFHNNAPCSKPEKNLTLHLFKQSKCCNSVQQNPFYTSISLCTAKRIQTYNWNSWSLPLDYFRKESIKFQTVSILEPSEQPHTPLIVFRCLFFMLILQFFQLEVLRSKPVQSLPVFHRQGCLLICLNVTLHYLRIN